MRLVDQFAGDRSERDQTALHYQVWSTREFLNTTEARTDEVRRLEEIVHAAERVSYSGRKNELAGQLLSYAEWLEGELLFAEAADVLGTALRLVDTSDRMTIRVHLQLGRVRRHLGQFDTSQNAYRRAGELATEMGDAHSELLSRIGRGIVLQKVGNLPESERVLREVLRAAAAQGDRDAEARACHDLAGCLHHMNRGSEGAPLAFRAYRLYEQPLQRIRALSDTGQILKEQGHYDAARKAFLSVIEREPPPEIRLRTAVELVDLSARKGDRISFERWRRDVTASYDRLPIDERVDFELKVGLGLAGFGRTAESREHLERAINLAEEHGLPEWLFRAEAALEEASEGHAAAQLTEPVAPPELRETLEGLHQLSVAAATPNSTETQVPEF